MSPTGGESGRRSLQLAYQLARWNEERGLGVVFDSSTGFKFPDGSILSPDAAFVERGAWEALSEAEREGFPPLAPKAVFEVRSASQDPEELRAKMGIYLRNGVLLGVLVDPYARAVEVFRPGKPPLRLEGVERVSLDPELPGFALSLPLSGEDQAPAPRFCHRGLPGLGLWGSLSGPPPRRKPRAGCSEPEPGVDGVHVPEEGLGVKEGP